MENTVSITTLDGTKVLRIQTLMVNPDSSPSSTRLSPHVRLTPVPLQSFSPFSPHLPPISLNLNRLTPLSPPIVICKILPYLQVPPDTGSPHLPTVLPELTQLK